MSGNPPAGYYTDPSIPGYIRYWDGTAWVAGTSRPAPEDQAAHSPADSGGGSGGAWRPEPALDAAQSSQGAVSGVPQSGAHQQYAQADARRYEAAGQYAPQGSAGYAPASGAQQAPQSPVSDAREQYAQAAAQQAVPEQFQQQYLPQQNTGQPQTYQQQAQAQAQAQVQQQIPQQFRQPAAPQPQPQSQPQPQAQVPQQYQPGSQSPYPQPQQPQQPQAPQPQPPEPQRPETVAGMVVPSAFAARGATGTFAYGSANPFAGLPGSPSAQGETESEAAETTVLELANPGSRILARIIDLGIAAVFSAPITVSLLLVAHRHDHQYVLKLEEQATSTYTTLGMDGTGIALWAGAAVALILVAIVYEGYRLGRGGQTAGKRLAGIRVVRLADAAPVAGGGLGLRRALMFWVLAVLPLIDLLALGGVLWGRPYRQGLHERVTSTATVKV